MSELDRPEGMLGTILAFEGISDSMTVVNGPTGCKFYPASASESSYRNRPDGDQTYNPYRYYNEFFFNQPRVPCTYMDGNDYIMGTRGRLDRAKDAIMELEPKLIGMINSPGASLIGEDLKLDRDPNIPVVRIETPDVSLAMGEGFQNATISILEAVRPSAERERSGINLIGISVWHLGWSDSINDIKDMLALCDIKVNMVLCAGCSTDDIRTSGRAELNVVLHEEFGLRTAEWYRSELNVPYINVGTPIGFDALESFIKGICDALNKDPAKALETLREKRRRAARILSCLSSSRRTPRGHTFSVFGEGSVVYGVCTFLYDHLGMIPVALDTGLDRTWNSRIGEFLTKNGLTVSEDVFGTPSDVMISNGNMIASATHRNTIAGGHAIERPGTVGVSVNERPTIGLGGTMRLLDSVLNVLERCGRTY